MRPRILLVLALVALALPAAALAARRVIHGPAGGGSGTVDITLVTSKKTGAVTKLTRFEFNNIQATCKGFPPTAVSGQFPHTIKVKSDGTFSANVKANGGRVTYTVSGKFKNPNSASGKLHVKGSAPGCPTADTGKVHWSAKHN